MKLKNVLLAICLGILMWGVGGGDSGKAYAQAGNVIGIASYGTTIDADGYMNDIGYLGAGTMLSESIGLIGQVGGTGTGAVGTTGDKEYGLGTSIFCLLSNKFIVAGGIWGTRHDKEGDAPIVNYGTIGGVLSYFPLGSGLFQEGEKIGLTIGVHYTPGLKQFLYGFGITILGGK